MCANKNASWSLRSAGIFVSGDGKQPRDSRCRSPPDFSLHGEFCKLNLQEVNNGIGVAVLITYSPQNGAILLVIAFLISPMGLPLAAIWLLGKVQDLKYAIQDWMYG